MYIALGDAPRPVYWTEHTLRQGDTYCRRSSQLLRYSRFKAITPPKRSPYVPGQVLLRYHVTAAELQLVTVRRYIPEPTRLFFLFPPLIVVHRVQRDDRERPAPASYLCMYHFISGAWS